MIGREVAVGRAEIPLQLDRSAAVLALANEPKANVERYDDLRKVMEVASCVIIPRAALLAQALGELTEQ